MGKSLDDKEKHALLVGVIVVIVAEVAVFGLSALIGANFGTVLAGMAFGCIVGHIVAEHK